MSFKEQAIAIVDKDYTLDKIATLAQDFFKIKDSSFSLFCKAALSEDEFDRMQWSYNGACGGIDMHGDFSFIKGSLSNDDVTKIFKEFSRSKIKEVQGMHVCYHLEQVTLMKHQFSDVMESNSHALKAFSHILR